MEFAWGFFTVIGTGSMSSWSKQVWKWIPTNSFPGSWMQRSGLGYLDSQHCSNLNATWAAVFFSILVNSARVEQVSITVSAQITSSPTFSILFVQGPMRSTATSSQGTDVSFRGGRWPCPGPEFLLHWQESQTLELSQEDLLSLIIWKIRLDIKIHSLIKQKSIKVC